LVGFGVDGVDLRLQCHDFGAVGCGSVGKRFTHLRHERV
jgi:hypothetical protein